MIPAAPVLLALIVGLAHSADMGWDRTFNLTLGRPTSGPGATVIFPMESKLHSLSMPGASPYFIYTAIHQWNLDDNLVAIASDDQRPPLPARPPVELRNSEFELKDASGAIRFKGKVSPSFPRTEFTSDNRQLVFLGSGGRLTSVDLETYSARELMSADAFALDAGRFLVGRDGKRFKGFDLLSNGVCGKYASSGDSVRCIPLQLTGALGLDEFYRPIRREVSVTQEDGRLKIVDRAGKTLFDEPRSDHFALSADGKRFAYADDKESVMVVDTTNFKTLRRFKKDSFFADHFSISPNGRYLRYAFGIFDIDSGTMRTVHGPIWSNLSPDESYAVTESNPAVLGESGLFLEPLAGGTRARIGDPGPSHTLFSPDGRWLFVASMGSAQKNPGRIYEVPSGRLVYEARHGWNNVVFSPDSHHLVYSRYEGGCDMMIVNLRSGADAALNLPKTGNSDCNALGFTGDGRWLFAKNNSGYYGWRWRDWIFRAQTAETAHAEALAVPKRFGAARDLEIAKSAADYAAKIAALSVVKGEFESSTEFTERKKSAEEQMALLRREADGEKRRLTDEWELKIRKAVAAAEETVESALAEEFFETVTAKAGAYDADAQEYGVDFEFNGVKRSARVPVSRQNAPDVKAREMTATIVFNHALKNGKAAPHDLRVIIKDPVLGELYSWSSDEGPARRARLTPEAPPRLELKVAFADADQDGAVSAGETARAIATVVNAGAGPAHAVSISLEPSALDGLGYAARHFLGEVPAGSSRSVSIPLKGQGGVTDGEKTLTLSARDANGFSADPFKVVFQTRARRGARLALAEFKVREAGGDGVVTPGELVELVLRVRNDGEGPSEGAAVRLSGSNADLFVQGEARRALGAIAPGQTVEVRYTVFSNTTLAGERMRFDAALTAADGSWTAPVEIPLRRALGATRELVVKSQAASAPPSAPQIADKPSAAGAAKPNAYAVVLGVEDYPKAARVSHARRDAAAFKEFAVKILGVPDDASHLFYLDDGVTLAELRKAFSPSGWLARRVGADSEVFVFYAGHGAPSLDGKGAYLVPQDGDPNYAVETGFPVDDLISSLAGIKAKAATVWLDACFSGADRENRPLMADARPLMLKADLRVPDGKVALFGAATGTQVSSAYPAKQHGLFSWFSMRGLDGEADANKDGTLTTGELADYLSARVPQAAGDLDREQTPVFRGDRTRVLARYKR